MDARPGGLPAKREPSPEGLGTYFEDDLSAGGAALNLGHTYLVIRRVCDFIDSREAFDFKRICHPDRSEPGFPATRHTPAATCAAFSKESRMKFPNATNFDRKSGVAQWRDLRFPQNTDPRLSLRKAAWSLEATSFAGIRGTTRHSLPARPREIEADSSR
jgi:hypothetical protein